MEARELLVEYNENMIEDFYRETKGSIEEKTKAIEKDYHDKLSQKVSEIKPKFLTGAFQSATGSFFFALVIIVFYLIIAGLSNPMNLLNVIVKQHHDYPIESISDAHDTEPN